LPFARAASRRSKFVVGVFAILLAVGAAVGLARGSSSGSTAPAPAGPRLAAGTALASSSRSSEAASVTRSHGVIVGHAVAHVRTRALRSIPPAPFRLRPEHEASRNPLLGSKTRAARDTVVQHRHYSPRMPSPTLNFDGIPFPGVSCGCAPPDTNGEVGATEYVQIVNTGFEVFNKATGANVLGPVDIATLWTGAGNVCE